MYFHSRYCEWSLVFLTPKEKGQMRTNRITHDNNSSYPRFTFILLNLDTKQSKSAQNSCKSLITLFIGFLNQKFTEMWYDVSSFSELNFNDFFQNSLFKGKSALVIPDSECSLLRHNSVFIHSAFPGEQGWQNKFKKNFGALRLFAGWGKVSWPCCQKNIQFVTFVQNCLQHPFVNTSLADALTWSPAMQNCTLHSKCWCCPPLSNRNAGDRSCQMVHEVHEFLKFQCLCW